MKPQVLLQAYYKRGKYVAVACPQDDHDGPQAPWWWDHLASQAPAIATDGFTAVWLPPVTKAAQGVSEAALGYSVFDDYDIGGKYQKATVHTRYGNREQLERCTAMLRACGVDVYLDLQLNHRKGGSGPDLMTFEYADAYGHSPGGRFPKHRTCFHSRYPANPVPADFRPEVPQDPNVPAGIWELQENTNIYFGPDFAHVNAQPPRYVADHLIAAVEWLTHALDVQGFRIDHVQGISTDFLRELLARDLLRDKFAVGEYWDGDIRKVQDWISAPRWMQGRCSAFDFPLYFKLLAMANDPGFDMASLDHAGLAGQDPLHAVTFVENHDTESRRDLVPRNIQPADKPLAYAYILTSEGYPCVFFKDWSAEPGCLGDQLRPVLRNLIWIHQNIAEGPTQQRWKEREVFVYERLAGARLLVGLNRARSTGRTLQGVQTSFGAHQRLHDYTGHAPDMFTDNEGRVTLNLPPNHGGLGYVCYSVPDITDRYAPTPNLVTQEYEGAVDLDIKPADRHAPTRVCRVDARAGSTIEATLVFDTTGWAQDSAIVLTLADPAGQTVMRRVFDAHASGATETLAVTAAGWYTFHVLAENTHSGNTRFAYTLRVRYQPELAQV